MKREEIKFQTEIAKMEKATAALERAKKNLEKKLAKAEKYGVENMTDEEHREWVKTVPVNEYFFMVNKEDVLKNGAWFDLVTARENLSDAEYKLQRAEEGLQKAQEELDKHHKEVDELEDLKKKEDLQKKEFEEEQKAWAEDGIALVKRYRGTTPNGKPFAIEGNNGWTERSRHCFTLLIGNEVVFTSGEFWRAYAVIKRS